MVSGAPVDVVPSTAPVAVVPSPELSLVDIAPLVGTLPVVVDDVDPDVDDDPPPVSPLVVAAVVVPVSTDP